MVKIITVGVFTKRFQTGINDWYMGKKYMLIRYHGAYRIILFEYASVP